MLFLRPNSKHLAEKLKSGFHVECQSCGARHKSIFCHLEMAELASFNDTKTCMSFKKGQTLFHEGGYPLGLFCVNDGKVKLSHSGQDGKEQIIHLAREGDVLGYRALLSAERYNATATALDDSNVCFIPKDAFFSVLRSSHGLSLEIIRLLATELRRAVDTITDLAQKPVRERTAEALLFLKETYGFEKDGITLNVILSREDIANLVGTATETAIRLLSEFKNDKIVELSGKKIRILDMPRLVRTANLSF